MSAEEYKTKGNAAVAEKKWSMAENFYSNGILSLNPWEKDLHVLLLSNRSFARLHMGKHKDALDDAEKAIDLDHFYEKAYIRKTAALEALKLKRAVNENDTSCPVLTCFREGLAAVPNSTLLKDAMKLSFPWLKDKVLTRTVGSTSDNQASSTNTNAKKKKQNAPTKAQRESCETVDIRGASGPHELRINGVYVPTEEVIGGWPVYRKRTDDDGYDDEDDLDEDDNTILEFQPALSEWMVKHVSCKGTHRSFIHCKSSPLSKPEDCLSVWQGIEDKKAIPQSTLSVLTERDRAEEDRKHFALVRPACKPVEVRGATGRKAVGINGIYEPTEVNHGGWPVYKKVIPPAKTATVSDTSASEVVDTNTSTSASMPTAGNPSAGTTPAPSTDSQTPPPPPPATTSAPPQGDSEEVRSISFIENDTRVWLEYNPYFKSWQIKPTVCLQTNRSWAYIVCTDHVGRRPELCTGSWDVLDDSDFRQQDNIIMMTVDAWKADDLKSKECWAHAEVLNIRGATGTYASVINGVFEPSPTFDGGYRKKADSSCVIEYNRKKQQWQMRTHSMPFAVVSDPARVTPDQCATSWSVLINGNWEVHPNISVMAAEKRRQLDLEKYGDKLAKAVALDIRGAVGMNAFKVNGVYEPTHETAGGWPVYQRKGSFDYWLEFNSERENWQIKSAANRGMDSAFAYVDASPPCSPESCEGPWWVYTGSKSLESSNGWEVQRSVTVMTVEKRQEEDMELFLVRKATCVPVDIRGAGGPRSSGLNGVFVPTAEMHGGWPVYQKRDDPDWWLEYDACPQKWMVRPTPCRGTTRGRAYILSDPSLRPEQVKGLWRMSDGKGGWAIEPSIYVRPESVAIEEDRIQFEARRATAVSIDLRGVSRPMSYINGVYEPTNESCFGWPVYKKQSSDNQWLEYHLPSREWQIKPTSCKGTKKNWAYVSSDPTHPELCTDAFWMVLVNGKHMKQEGVTLLSLEQRAREDKLLAEQRRSSCVPIIISGASGKSGELINGLYEPSSTKTCGGWPSYFRQGAESRSLLEFNIYAMSWTITAILFKKQVVETVASGEGDEAKAGDTVTTSKLIVSSPPSLVAFVEVTKYQRPEQARENLWKVLGQEKFEPQDTVIVSPKRGSLEEPSISELAMMPTPQEFDADEEAIDDVAGSTTGTGTAEANMTKSKKAKKKAKSNDKDANTNGPTSSTSTTSTTTKPSTVSDKLRDSVSTSTQSTSKDWIEVGGNKKTKASKPAPASNNSTSTSSTSSAPQVSSTPLNSTKPNTTTNARANETPKNTPVPVSQKPPATVKSPEGEKSSTPAPWSDIGKKTKLGVPSDNAPPSATVTKPMQNDTTATQVSTKSAPPPSFKAAVGATSYKEVIAKQKSNSKSVADNSSTSQELQFNSSTQNRSQVDGRSALSTFASANQTAASDWEDADLLDEDGLSMAHMMQEFQALGSQTDSSSVAPYSRAVSDVPRGYEDDDDLFEAIRSASIVTGLDLEHPFPLSDQYFDSFPSLTHPGSSLADFSDDLFGGASLGKVPSVGQSLMDHAGVDLSSGFTGLAQLNHQPAVSLRSPTNAASLTMTQSPSDDLSSFGMYSQPQSMTQLSQPHSFARTHHASQYSAFLSGSSQLSAPPFQAHSHLHSNGFPTTDQLSTTSTTTPGSSEYLSETHLQQQQLNANLGLALGLDSSYPLEAGGDPNPALIKESDLLVSDEFARLDREKTFGESVFPAMLWGRPVFVRKLNNNLQAPIPNEPHPGDGEKLRLDFLRELQVLTDFRHGNILPLQAFSFWPMILAYSLLPDRITVLELMSDTALVRSLHWNTRLRIVSSICSALVYVHHGCPELSRPGIVHRNVHPGNVLVNVEDGDTLLCDFRQSRELDCRLSTVLGLGMAMGSGPGPNSMCADLRADEGWLVGSPGYIDPLYLRSRIYSPHSDVYSLGVILMQLLLGLPPNDGDQLGRSVQSFMYHCQPLQGAVSPPPLSSLNDVLGQLERLRGPDSPVWPPRAFLQTARVVSACLSSVDFPDRDRGLGVSAESLQLSLLEIANSNTSNVIL